MNKWRMGLILLLLLVLVGCGGSDSDSENPVNPPDFGESDGVPENFPFGNAQWPESIPADIPELEGEIRLVMEAPTHIRIFYEGLSERQVEKYLDLLEDKGFTLQFIVYTRDGFPDTSEERLKKGEWDAVDMAKGEYHMRLEYGAEQATYDVDTAGFED